MEIKRDWLWKRYTIICEDDKDEKFLKKLNEQLDKLDDLEKELEEKDEFIDDLRSSIKWNAIKDIIFWILLLIWCIVDSWAFN